MLQVVQASELTLHEVKKKFILRENQDDSFFPEWQENLPELTDTEKQTLDQNAVHTRQAVCNYTQDDTPDKIDYGRLSRVVYGLEQVVDKLVE